LKTTTQKVNPYTHNKTKAYLIRKFDNFFAKSFLPDAVYLKIEYYLKTGKKLNLKNPVLFNEKIQWLKLNDRQPEYPNLADKHAVRDYVAKTIGKEYLIPSYGVWDTFDEIPFDTLPGQFVLKCTHDSGSVIICKDKQSLDMEKIRKHFKRRLARNWYWRSRQWVYKNIKPRIIAEKLLVEENNAMLNDYKIFCFNGEPQIIGVKLYSPSGYKANFYSPKWEYQPFAAMDCPTDPNVHPEKPESLELMIDLARKLSAQKTHVRVDFYYVNKAIYFGEITFYHAEGLLGFDPPEWDKTFGDWMQLPQTKDT
jgi:hypothetical protein